MYQTIARLAEISQKKSRVIVGTMSGTSLDGLDVVICRVHGQGEETIADVLYFTTFPYTDETRGHIQAVFAKKMVLSEHLCQLHAYLGKLHGEIILKCLEQAGIRAYEVDLIASHGQTVFHHPGGTTWYPHPSTFQIGDGDHIARHTGIITISDFRQKHVAAGGEGAPLAMYGEEFLFRHEEENRILLNLGGIGNITFLPSKQRKDAFFTTDTGPANTLVDQYCQRYLGIPYDHHGELAGQGKCDEKLLKVLKQHPFFSMPFPKSTGQEDFNIEWIETLCHTSGIASYQPADMVATLTRFTAESVIGAVKKCVPMIQPLVLYVSGGGIHNVHLIRLIAQNLPEIPVKSLSETGIDPDAKEALLFAILANETVAGYHRKIMTHGFKDYPDVHFGKISLPD